MTVSINIPHDKIATLSKLDKSAILFSLACKYANLSNSNFVAKAKLYKRCGAFAKCFDVCKIDILPHCNLSSDDQKVFELCK